MPKVKLTAAQKAKLIEKAKNAKTILKSYSEITGSDPEDCLTDLLADMMHLCRIQPSQSFVSALVTAQAHFDAEQKGDI